MTFQFPPAIIERLLKGPSKDEKPNCWVVAEWSGKEDTITEYKSAVVEHFPGVEKPSHLIVWSIASVHVYDYHSVNYCYERKL